MEDTEEESAQAVDEKGCAEDEKAEQDAVEKQRQGGKKRGGDVLPEHVFQQVVLMQEIDAEGIRCQTRQPLNGAALKGMAHEEDEDEQGQEEGKRVVAVVFQHEGRARFLPGQ